MLLIDRNTLLLLDLSLYIPDCVIWINSQLDSFSRIDVDENLYARPCKQKESGSWLNVVVGEDLGILKFLAFKAKMLLIKLYAL